jgi:hypothetical protein
LIEVIKDKDSWQRQTKIEDVTVIVVEVNKDKDSYLEAFKARYKDKTAFIVEEGHHSWQKIEDSPWRQQRQRLKIKTVITQRHLHWYTSII